MWNTTNFHDWHRLYFGSSLSLPRQRHPFLNCIVFGRPPLLAASQHLIVLLILICSAGRTHPLRSPEPLPPPPPPAAAASVSELPCLYEGHVQTNRDWYGYLANVTVLLTGRMTFEFSYPADKCCQSVLFYLEDQMGVVNARTNCWQKEAVLSAENDQILRLTPRFSWSGCHLDYPHGLPTYICQGGRSFTAGSNGAGDRPTTWYMAVSNCATLMGIDLYYKLIVYGHYGDCKSGYRYNPRSDTFDKPNEVNNNHYGPYNPSNNQGGKGGTNNPVNPKTGEVIRQPSDGNRINSDEQQHGSSSSAASSAHSKKHQLTGSANKFDIEESNPQGKVCVVRGVLVSNGTWHGYIANISVGAGGGFRYTFVYPYDMQVQNILLYDEYDVNKLNQIPTTREACWHRERVIRAEDLKGKILDLMFTATWNGCASRNATQHAGLEVTCRGERRFNSPQQVYVAVSNCRSTNGLQLDYRFEISGFDGKMACSRATSLQPSSSLLLNTSLLCILVYSSGNTLLQYTLAVIRLLMVFHATCCFSQHSR